MNNHFTRHIWLYRIYDRLQSRCRIRLLSLLLVAMPAFASNPVITTAYSADPSGHVFNGRMYIYASHDRNDARGFDMVDYHVYSSDDLQNWQDHGIALRLKDIPWAASNLWAPDCNYWKGKYYLYFPARDAAGHRRIGVAVSKSPAGPFIAEKMPIADVEGIDPSIYIDTDGLPWLIWADNGPVIARLKSNMTELKGTARKIEGANEFFEGPWVFRRNGTYYLTYAAYKPGGVRRGGHGQHYDYAVSASITDPYSYKGTFADSGPGGDNIHGSQVEWHGDWYCFYHDFSTSQGRPFQNFKRNVRLDRMAFAADGSIEPLQETESGPPQLKPLDPYTRVEAEDLNATDVPEGPHAIPVDGNAGGVVYLGPVMDGDWVRYAGAEFRSGPSAFTARVASATGGGVIDLYLDRPDATNIAHCEVHYTGGWSEWQTVSCPVAPISGIHDLILVFTGESQHSLFNIDWFQFNRRTER